MDDKYPKDKEFKEDEFTFCCVHVLNFEREPEFAGDNVLCCSECRDLKQTNELSPDAITMTHFKCLIKRWFKAGGLNK